MKNESFIHPEFESRRQLMEVMGLSKKWIKPLHDLGDVCPVYVKKFSYDLLENDTATLTITAMGMYEAELNGTRIGEYIFAPGWTSVKRLQYQVYDVSHLIKKDNILTVTVGKGWRRSPIPGWIDKESADSLHGLPPGLNARIAFSCGHFIETDYHWEVCESPVRFSEIYGGETFDARISIADFKQTEEFDNEEFDLVIQQGEEIREQERISPVDIMTTANGETVIDFGQNLTGYLELTLPTLTKAGDVYEFSFAEVLDKDGNFYNDNYRGAKSKLKYLCRAGSQVYKPKFTFFGFRYVRIDSAPLAPEATMFRAIAVHSAMERTGFFSCSHPLVNRLYENILWGQKGNFLDVPTDCPQRDERLGWTGDAQVFIKTAAYNYDVEKFFTKWLTDLTLDQDENGRVPHVIPNALPSEGGSAAWGDAATICPWELYFTYGNKDILRRQFASMQKWVDFITASSKTPYLWTGGEHFGDWLALELPENPDMDERKGATNHDFIASAFYARSTMLLIKAGKELGIPVDTYETLYENIVQTFRETFTKYRTQTEYILALHFGLLNGSYADVAKGLAEKVVSDGCHLTSGFVGTPYLLHALSKNGQADLAYTLLLREDYPSWLYPVTKGATTVWERWDSLKPDGSFQTTDMNSFNHYAYGAVADWLYSVAAGINPKRPGYEEIRIEPIPDSRLTWLSAQYKSKYGWVRSKWQYTETGTVRYDIETPVKAEIIINHNQYIVDKGSYVFFG